MNLYFMEHFLYETEYKSDKIKSQLNCRLCKQVNLLSISYSYTTLLDLLNWSI